MHNYIHKMDDFSELFDRLEYKEEKFWVHYSAMMIDIIQKDRLEKFWKYLLEYLNKSDTIFYYSKTKVIILLEETAMRWTIHIHNKFRKKLKHHWIKFKFYSSAIQWHWIEDIESLIKSLKKRLKKAKHCKTNELVYSLSFID